MIQFIVKNKESNKVVSPRNYYFVIKQNGELYTFNGAGAFEKADNKYEYEILRKQHNSRP